MVVLAWLLVFFEEVKMVEEEEVLVDRVDIGGLGKRFVLGVERVRGWKETVGDIGLRGDVRSEIMFVGSKIKGEINLLECYFKVIVVLGLEGWRRVFCVLV